MNRISGDQRKYSAAVDNSRRMKLDPMLLLVFPRLHKSPSQQAPTGPRAHTALN